MLPSPGGKNATALWQPDGAPTAAPPSWRWEAAEAAPGAAGGGGEAAAAASGSGAARAVAAGSLLSLLVVWTLLGNALVCAAILGCRHLRAKVTNIFLASLAVSDLLVALLVMPWKAAAEVAGYWPFGAFCSVWVAFDIMCSTASILNLCVISLDRYWAISSPFRYERKMTPRVALAMVGLAWALALLVSFLPVQLNWHKGPDATPASLNGSGAAAWHCDSSLNRTYAISSSLISFYIPVAIMLVTYSRIYRIAQGQIRRISSLERAAEHAQSCRSSPRRPCAPPALPLPPPVLKASLRKEARVLKTLAIIMGVFVCCWLPFFVLNCLMPFCPRAPDGAPPPARLPCVSDATFDIFVWFGWANSSLNPIIYAFNADFRKVFFSVLGCGRRCSPTPVETANLSHELLSYHQDALTRPHHLPTAEPIQPSRRISPASLEPTDCELDLSLDAAPPFTPRGLL
ncbi:D(1B) dopamine receptor [Eublepharis macularius]|uniref:D(1B) dopamine receptor n=1 Tax=Eublepharis macularius TaxID=481883 RepID=A0AA97LGV1_EUBMA|nr:D(1B) dopamine receptor [Eublepharis macularius]